MTTAEYLSRWEQGLDELVLIASSTNVEAAANTLILEIAEAARCGATSSDIAAFLGHCCQRYSATAGKQGLQGLFYCWFDAMSATLRCSFSSKISPEELPFGCAVRPASDLGLVAERAMQSKHLDGIPFEELTEEECAGNGVEEEFILDVWVARVPGNCKPILL